MRKNVSASTYLKPVVLGALVFIAGLVIKKQVMSKKNNDVLTIGILQTTSHPAFARVRKGLIERIKQNLGSKVVFVIQNGEGSVSQLYNMAKSLQSKIDAVCTIGTQASQAMASVEKKKPIVIAAVTDPHAAGLIHPGTNVCGTTDKVDTNNQVKLIKSLVPDVTSVCLLYNPGEVNSTTMVKEMCEQLTKENIKPIKVGISNESEIGSASIVATKRGDAILVPLDNLVVGAMPTVAQIATKAKKALIVCDNPSVERGALACAGVDYYQCGKLSGEIMLEVLAKGKKPCDLPPRQPQGASTVINKKTLEALNMTVPATLKDTVKLLP